ncbi:hypothetical protein CCH79_00019795 [Gambusia affinis]|uniref:Uncharacterized protein n=1 Tax=Gambusia affinis TaxID=33528 RepID=A0A315VD13_GAMAF|nr:hypothetical protein CCH79_00019795 [Gambusia affinis]
MKGTQGTKGCPGTRGLKKFKSLSSIAAVYRRTRNNDGSLSLLHGEDGEDGLNGVDGEQNPTHLQGPADPGHVPLSDDGGSDFLRPELHHGGQNVVGVLRLAAGEEHGHLPGRLPGPDPLEDVPAHEQHGGAQVAALAGAVPDQVLHLLQQLRPAVALLQADQVAGVPVEHHHRHPRAGRTVALRHVDVLQQVEDGLPLVLEVRRRHVLRHVQGDDQLSGDGGAVGRI